MKQLTCLLVDDDHEESEIFNYAAEELRTPLRCHKSSNGKEAISMLVSGVCDPDFILLDLYMPRMDGAECLAVLKSLPGISKIPVIIYSTGISDEKHHEMKLLGANGFLEKTSNIADLAVQLQQLIKEIAEITAVQSA
jgi:CheY-like chemotaxis protein